MGKRFIAAALTAAALGGFAAATVADPDTASIVITASCASDEYENSQGDCIIRPTDSAQPPEGATFVCEDGTYSSSVTSRGACSRHGGIDHAL
ncbi:DUF3761 domain-containing protein [Mycobacterium sp. 852002-51152_SCH6134967]|uniref:DUF3761 domain-containing protein n=1 Tax=Mycobacterium sp. 852002-51152_SCH6134967 TaxID=1834096 RepID=UPI0009ED58D1|nr:DUF3761 domain-containing protein [Mycobacterium sp. 852002-51152_SCH6134967]